MNYRLIIYLLIFLNVGNLMANVEILPVNFKGRILPLDVYSKLLLYEFYHAQEIENNDLSKFPLSTTRALDFLIKLYLEGPIPFQQSPLFYVQSQELKKALHLEGNIRTSYDNLNLLKNPQWLSEDAEKEWSELQKKMHILKTEHKLKMLPSLYKPSEWMDLLLLKNSSGFTLFSKEAEENLKNELQTWIKNPTFLGGTSFSQAYLSAYQGLTDKDYSLTQQTTYQFPSITRLQLEQWYYTWPLIHYSILCYLIAVFLLLMSEGFPYKTFFRVGLSFYMAAWALLTILLLSRWLILHRPPVSNMAETLMYVPWITGVMSLCLSYSLKFKTPLIASAGVSIILLSILEWTFGSQSLDNVQAVLNSQFWLTIHVLMIVGSYGVLILSGALAHIHLFKRESPRLTKAILQSMYIGVSLLIPGTLLGGVWAAQSWGRFWDWDPKESWAFISAAIYLLVIHSYRFHWIGAKGLSIGAILGMLSISFTWYGVNYILGTGLHSYGFGLGGEWMYYTFLCGEIILIGRVLFYKRSFLKS